VHTAQVTTGVEFNSFSGHAKRSSHPKFNLTKTA